MLTGGDGAVSIENHIKADDVRDRRACGVVGGDDVAAEGDAGAREGEGTGISPGTGVIEINACEKWVRGREVVRRDVLNIADKGQRGPGGRRGVQVPVGWIVPETRTASAVPSIAGYGRVRRKKRNDGGSEWQGKAGGGAEGAG